MGYTRRERLLRVELPLAVPLIMAGIRLASVTTIGLATVAAVLGDSFGGLGQLITEGLQTFFPTKYLLGAVLSVALAFAADFLLVRLERLVTPWAQARAGGALMDGVVAFFLDPANWSGHDRHPEPAPRAPRDLRPGDPHRDRSIALPIGLYIGHTNRGSGLAINLANIGRAIPSYAMMVIPLPLTLALAPVIGYAPTFGLDFLPILVAMTFLAIPPLLVSPTPGCARSTAT